MRRLSGLQLARMRRVADATLAGEGEVWRRTRVSDNKGGKTETLARVSSGPWRLAALTTVASSESVFAARLGGQQGWWATAQYHVDINLADQVRIGGRTFEVVSVDTGRTWHISARVLCREVT